MKLEKMNIDELQAGRELDALIAEKVMGWTEIISDGLYCWRDIENDECTGEFSRQENVAGYTVEDIKAWSPSTDIAAAWRVVEKLDNKIALQAPGTTDMSEGCEYYKNWTVELDSYQARGDTAPLAICRAALKAVSGKQ